MGRKTTAMSAVTSLADADLAIVVDDTDTTTKKITVGNLKATLNIDDESTFHRWSEIAAASYTALPDSTSRILMSDTSRMAVGYPLRYAYGGTTYYGIVTAVSANVHVDVAGATLDGGQALTALAVGAPELVVVKDYVIAGAYGDGADDLLDGDLDGAAEWLHSAAYLVRFGVKEKTVDTGAEPKVNVNVGGSAISTTDTNKGIQVSTSWQYTTIDINLTNYVVANGDALEIACTEAGGVGDADALSVQMIFVLA